MGIFRESGVDLIITVSSIGSLILGSFLLIASAYYWYEPQSPIFFINEIQEPIQTPMEPKRNDTGLTMYLYEKMVVSDRGGDLQVSDRITLAEFSNMVLFTIIGAIFSILGGGLQIPKLLKNNIHKNNV